MSQGAPVEAAVDHAHKYVFATNYSMYGANFGPEGSDELRRAGRAEPELRVPHQPEDAGDRRASRQVGMVPKYVAVTPDDKYVLVTNWCSYDLSVVDHNTLQEVQAHPRSARTRAASRSTATSHVAYVAVMGSSDIARIDLTRSRVSYFRGVGNSPRHLVLSPDGTRLFVTLNGDNQRRRGRHRDRATSSRAPRPATNRAAWRSRPTGRRCTS